MTQAHRNMLTRLLPLRSASPYLEASVENLRMAVEALPRYMCVGNEMADLSMRLAQIRHAIGMEIHDLEGALIDTQGGDYLKIDEEEK